MCPPVSGLLLLLRGTAILHLLSCPQRTRRQTPRLSSGSPRKTTVSMGSVRDPRIISKPPPLRRKLNLAHPRLVKIVEALPENAELCVQGLRHGPADDAAAERIERDRQIEK